MTLSRRTFVASMAAAAVTPPLRLAAGTSGGAADGRPGDGSFPGTTAGREARPAGGPAPVSPGRFDPWIQVDPEALAHNVGVVSGLVGGRPIMAVIKNNAYGLGLTTVAEALEPHDGVMGFAVVKAEAALALREAGIRKPILLMSLFADGDVEELIARDIHLALCTDDAPDRAAKAGRKVGRRPLAHVYLDTGMSRMGIPYHRAFPWLEHVASLDLQVDGTFMGFTEDPDFDREQLRRFREVAEQARGRGIALGALHAASSHAVFHFADAHLDLVRPGIALFGAYPSNARTEGGIAQLRPALRLQARVVRVERLRPGDSVSYGRNYVAERPTWIATLPVGHTDGYPREAVKGARVVIGGRAYPVIGAVSASHTIVELGDETTVAIGDLATFIGPDHPATHPNAVAEATGRSVYDILMHLNPTLPKVVG